jgi:BR-signaling kinase
MGCCRSSLRAVTHPMEKPSHNSHHRPTPRASFTLHQVSAPSAASVSTSSTFGAAPSFTEYTLTELKAATNGFAAANIVSESGEKAPNHVYKGELPNCRSIAVKKFPKMAWPDPKQFAVSFVFVSLICC